MLVTAMTDHPSWLVNSGGTAYRAVRCGANVWSVTTSGPTDQPHVLRTHCMSGVRDDPPLVDIFDPSTLVGPESLVHPLRTGGPVGRLRNPDLWDALATSIVRQVIRAGHARKLYRVFCQEHGDHVTTPAGDVYLFPSPQTVLALSDGEFARLGLAFKRRPLQAAAQALLELGDTWAGLAPSRLADELQTVPRIGPWTAGATVADFTNDYALYPYADLAVRTWAQRLAPEREWPEKEPQFARVWQELAGHQLSEWTVLTLAWGVRHANGAAI